MVLIDPIHLETNSPLTSTPPNTAFLNNDELRLPEPSKPSTFDINLPPDPGEWTAGATVNPYSDVSLAVNFTPPTPIASPAVPTQSLVFIDSSLADVSQLIAGVAPNAQAILLESNQDGIAQISQVLASYHQAGVKISALHLVSYGTPGSLQLGNTQLNSETLKQYHQALASWKNVLTADADMLIYGCDVTATPEGNHLLGQIASLTGADIAASRDRTGNAALGGDWELESQWGNITTPLAFTPELQASYSSVFDTFSIRGVSLAEGNLGSSPTAQVTVNLNRTGNQLVSVAVTTANGTAVTPGDYQSVNTTLFFGATDTTRVVSIPITGDNNVEPNEIFLVNLSNASTGSTIGVAQAEVTIVNDDQLLISVNNVTITESDTATSNASFVITLTEPTTQPVTVNYTTANGTATPTVDYQTVAGSVTFAPGETRQTVTVPVVGDILVENNETFFLQLSNSSANASIGVAQGTATIVDNDQFFLTVSSTTITETDSGSTNATVTVSLSAASTQAISVAYTAVGNDATVGTDFNATTGTLNFAPGERLKTITVPVLGDTTAEFNETFLVQLSNPVGATVTADSQGTITILDEDHTISGLKWEDLNNDGVRDTAEPVFPGVTIYLDANDNAQFDAGESIAVTNAQGRYSFTDLLIQEYVVREIVPAGFVQTFPEGEQLQGGVRPPTPPIQFGDVQLSTPAGDGSVSLRVDAFGSITDDAPYDPVGAGTAAATVFASDVAFRVGTSGTREFLQRSTGNDPGFVEVDGTSSVKSNFTIGGLNFTLTQSLRELRDGSGTRTGSFLNQTYAISNPGTSPVTFELVRYLDGDLRFDGSLIDGGGRLVAGGREILFETDRAGLPADADTFVGITAEGGNQSSPGRFEIDQFSGLRTRIAAGTALDEQITGDGTDADQFIDDGQGYDVTLALRNLFTLAPGRSTTYTTGTIFGTGVPQDLDFGEEGFYRLTPNPTEPITNADFGNFRIPIPDISIAGISNVEGTGGTTNFEFRVSLSVPTIVPVEVDFTTADGTAQAGSDFNATTGTLTFNPGETEKIITVPVIADDVIEPTESFTVRLTGTRRGVITQAEATGTITDDDLPVVTIGSAVVTEGDSGTQNANFNIQLSRPGIFPTTVQFATQNGTATAGSDYQAVQGNLTFAVGETQKTITVPILGDTQLEPDETFFLVLSGITNATPNQVQGLGSIINDEVSVPTLPPPSPTPPFIGTPPSATPPNPAPPLGFPTVPTPSGTPVPTPSNPSLPGVPSIPTPIVRGENIREAFTLQDLAQFFPDNPQYQNLNFQDPRALIFDEGYYLARNPLVAQAVAAGQFQSGFQHFLQFGQFEGRDPSSLFNTSFYLSQYPEVAQAVAQGAFRSAFQHFITAGLPEGRNPSQLFDNQAYLAQNPDVAQAVAGGAYSSAIEHYLRLGQFEGRLNTAKLFDATYYLSNYPAVAEAVAQGIFRNAFEHYVRFGQFEQRNPSALFNESFYLGTNPDIAQAVAQGQFRSGFEHYILFGRAEGRAARPA